MPTAKQLTDTLLVLAAVKAKLHFRTVQVTKAKGAVMCL